MDADLIFPDSYKMDGFTTEVTSREAGDPDPVIRELLQNSLDAAVREAHRPRAEVRFTIARRPLDQLPGLQSYREAFEAARREHGGAAANQTHDQQTAVQRIAQRLQTDELSVLFCRDNGIGLNAKRLTALLSEGKSDKGTAGAGSYGLGHLAAYAASDLRYILYAGRTRQNGTHADIASGHAIVAAHKIDGARRAPDGYWMMPADLFSLEQGDYPSTPPPLFDDQVAQIEDTGSVIAIAGFNHFHEDADSAVDAICRVAALNFMAAIWHDRMLVEVRDESSGRVETVDRDSLEPTLRRIKEQRRAPAAGWLAGSQGYRALETLRDGRMLDRPIDRSIEVRFRSLGDDASERSRVQVYRDGMWIANNAPELDTGAFGGVQPFDAVVMLEDHDSNDHTEFYDLVRNSEGPEHRGLHLKRLTKDERDQLRRMLRQLAERLRDEAGELSMAESYTPHGFAVFDGKVERAAEHVPRLRQRPQEGSEAATNPTAAETTESGNRTNEGQRSGRTHRRRAPGGGRAVRVRSAHRPQVDDQGMIRQLEARLRVDESIDPRDHLLLSVRISSGSDESCEKPLPPSWLPIGKVSVGGALDARVIDAAGAYEVVLPPESERLRVDLAEPVPAGASLELDLVRRRPSAERTSVGR